jgi:hypothetical protein
MDRLHSSLPSSPSKSSAGCTPPAGRSPPTEPVASVRAPGDMKSAGAELDGPDGLDSDVSSVLHSPLKLAEAAANADSEAEEEENAEETASREAWGEDAAGGASAAGCGTQQAAAGEEGVQEEDAEEDELNDSFGPRSPRPKSAAYDPHSAEQMSDLFVAQESLLDAAPSPLEQTSPRPLEHQPARHEAGDSQEDQQDQVHARTASPAKSTGDCADSAPSPSESAQSRWATSRVAHQAPPAAGAEELSVSVSGAGVAAASTPSPPQDMAVQEYSSTPHEEQASWVNANLAAPWEPLSLQGPGGNGEADSSRQAVASMAASADVAQGPVAMTPAHATSLVHFMNTVHDLKSSADSSSRGPQAALAHEALAHSGSSPAPDAPTSAGASKREVAHGKAAEASVDEAQMLREREETRKRMRNEARKIKEAAALASSPSAASTAAQPDSATAHSLHELPASSPMAGGSVKRSDSLSLSATEAEVGIGCLQRVATVQEQPYDDIRA